MPNLFYECRECGQELFRCDACKHLFHAREMGLITTAQSLCIEHMAAILQRLPLTVDVKKKPVNFARLRLVERAN